MVADRQRRRSRVETTMVNVPDTKLGRMFQQHIQYILDKNIEALLDQYTDDCLLISSFMKTPKYYRGRAELREHMQGILGIQGLEDEIVFWAETQNPETLMITEKITMKTTILSMLNWKMKKIKISKI